MGTGNMADLDTQKPIGETYLKKKCGKPMVSENSLHILVRFHIELLVCLWADQDRIGQGILGIDDLTTFPRLGFLSAESWLLLNKLSTTQYHRKIQFNTA